MVVCDCGLPVCTGDYRSGVLDDGGGGRTVWCGEVKGMALLIYDLCGGVYIPLTASQGELTFKIIISVSKVLLS